MMPPTYRPLLDMTVPPEKVFRTTEPGDVAVGSQPTDANRCLGAAGGDEDFGTPVVVGVVVGNREDEASACCSTVSHEAPDSAVQEPEALTRTSAEGCRQPGKCMPRR